MENKETNKEDKRDEVQKELIPSEKKTEAIVEEAAPVPQEKEKINADIVFVNDVFEKTKISANLDAINVATESFVGTSILRRRFDNGCSIVVRRIRKNSP